MNETQRFFIVQNGLLWGVGRTPEAALRDACSYSSEFGAIRLRDVIDNTNGRQHHVTNLDVVLRDNLIDVVVL